MGGRESDAQILWYEEIVLHLLSGRALSIGVRMCVCAYGYVEGRSGRE